ncbi:MULTISPECIES: YciI family protein [unclassified Streptomyces]|uniref:YciI family protein n=1 Tax=unclassified Streptomyces TaxID=2593676 RepID=UPI0032546135
MFIVELTYIVPLERVEEHLADHVAWLDAQYEAGVFIASGRKEPRDGGVILAVGDDRAAIDKIVATDPFNVNDLATYRITEFLATKVAPELAAFQQELPPAA